jgi:hypothetical protein
MATAKQFQVNTLSGGTLTTGLVSYWNMEGNSNDFYGSNNGTDTSVSYGTSYGKVGQGALFASSASNVSVADNSNLSPASFSLAVWVYFTSTATGHNISIVKSLQNSGVVGWLIQISNTDINIQSGYGYADWSQTISYNTWHFIVLTQTGTSAYLYIDNVSKGSQVSTAIANQATPLKILVNGGSNYLDEMGIWSKALSTNEISDLYNAGAGQTMVWGDTQSDSMMNADSRFATVAFTKRFVAALAATIMNAASRFTTLAGNLLILVRNVSVTMMNAASRLTMLAGTITKYVTALSVSMMNSASRLATLFGQQMQYIANLSVSMMNAVSRLVVLTTGNMKILVVNMMNAAGRFTTIYSQVSLYIRNLTVNMMYAVNRLTSFLVTIPGTWAFRAKNLTSWAFRSKNNTSWTFRTKNPPGAENIPSEPN